MDPPGLVYREWSRLDDGDDVMSKVAEAFGPDSGKANVMRLLLEYRRFYGPYIPVVAARHLDLILEDTDWAEAMNVTPTETRESLHTLHAQGLVLIADDGSLWLTVPPGTPHSAPNGEWAFVERKAYAPREPAAK
ncbi:hypothetical protein [Streptomyces clavuligerus]|uniref:hypothetical protein n=1 Tax=Streptomyces clavuligerus TaxID=1901 RepID=UPI00018516A1|nr:hypothetical protein [Streptomyces clavuligerus]WDN55765.1 hypothetical protein LL058_28110 [Streptomyces clavuligerus]